MADEEPERSQGSQQEEKQGLDDASPTTPNESQSTTKQQTKESPLQAEKLKIDVLLKPAGDAPIMKKKKWTVDRSKKISWISEFIKKYLKFEPNESMFLYVNQSFAPAPDTDVGSIFDCFGSDGKLVLHYCKTQAWG